MKTKTLTTLILLISSFASFANTQAIIAASKKKKAYEIGQETQGGIVFYLNKSKTHGLVAAKKDQMENAHYADCLEGINDPANHDAEGAAYLDWRMPKLWEAYKMYMNLHLVNLGNFSASSYWTSKEWTGFDKMYVLNFAKGLDFTSLKTDTYRARAVRSF